MLSESNPNYLPFDVAVAIESTVSVATQTDDVQHQDSAENLAGRLTAIRERLFWLQAVWANSLSPDVAREADRYRELFRELADQLRQGGVPIDDVFDRTRLAVNQATGGATTPWSASKLSGTYYLLARAADAAPPGSNIPALSTPLKTLSPAEAYDLAVLRDRERIVAVMKDGVFHREPDAMPGRSRFRLSVA